MIFRKDQTHLSIHHSDSPVDLMKTFTEQLVILKHLSRISLAIGAGLLVFSSEVAQGEVAAPITLPPGVSIQTATPNQLATAVKAAIAKNPGKAKAIVAHAVAELSVTKNPGTPNFSQEALIQAIITAAVASVPSSEVPPIVAAACTANPGLAAVIIQTAVTLVPTQAIAIELAAIRANPSLATTIVSAAIAAAPDQGPSLSAAANGILQGSSEQGGGQGNVQGMTSESFLQTEGINPENTINLGTTINPNPSQPSPTPHPVSPHQ